MAKVKAKFKGRAELENKISLFAPRSLQAAAEAKEEAFTELAEKIRTRAPVDDGDYRDSIRSSGVSDADYLRNIKRKFKQSKDLSVVGLFASPLWRLLEFGTNPRVQDKTGRATGAVRKRPHIFPTYRQMRKRLIRKVNKAMRDEVRKVAKNKK